jgi:hypothetical protein
MVPPLPPPTVFQYDRAPFGETPCAFVVPKPMARARLLPITTLFSLMLSGCTVSPWSADSPWLARSPKAEPAAAEKSSVAEKPSAAKDSASAPPAGASATAAKVPGSEPPNAYTLQKIMAELREMGTVDPQARDRLMDDLRQTDPSLWPLVMKQFNATLAYRRRVAETALVGQAGSAGAPPRTPTPQAAPPSQPAFPQLAPTQYAPLQSVPAQPVQLSPAQPVYEAPPPMMPVAPTAPIGRLPPTSDSPQTRYDMPGGVVAASYASLADSQWQQRLAGAAESLERQLPATPRTSADTAQYARLRMMNVVGGRTIDGLRLVPAANPGTQDFWLHELSGLATCLDVEHIPDDAVRAAEAKAMLVEATTKLGESASLVVRNLSFCVAVQSFGCFKRFEKNEFTPEQETLLYAEVENFVAVPTPQGFHTSFKSRCQLLDAVGKCVCQQDFPPTEEDCQNVRRDFFIGYHVRMPKAIVPGKYALQLAIEDLKSHKVGQASIEFVIKGPAPAKTGKDAAPASEAKPATH